MLLTKRSAKIFIFLCTFVLFSALNTLSVVSQEPPTLEPSPVPVEIPTELPPTAVPPTATFTEIPPPTATNTELPSPTFTETQTETPTETAVPLTETPTATASETASATLLPMTETPLVTTTQAVETTQEAETTSEPQADAPSSNSFSLLEEEPEYYAMINFDDPTLLDYSIGERVTGDGNIGGVHETLSGVGYNGSAAYKETATWYDTSWFALLVIVVELDPSWEVVGFGGLVKSEVDGTLVGQAAYVRYHTAGGGWSGLIGLTAGQSFDDWQHRYYRPASALSNIDRVQYEVHLRGTGGARIYLDDWHAVLTTPLPTLTDFGIDLEGNWLTEERSEILTGAFETGTALHAHGAGTDVVEAFRIVMEGKDELDNWRKIRIYRSSSLGGVYCDTTSLPTGEYSASIACHPDVAMTQYTTVHEFGHVFDGRTNSELRLLVEAPDPLTLQLRNMSNEFVMGKRSYNLLGSGLTSDWQRSDIDTDNGWGSAALWNEQSYWGPYTVASGATPTLEPRYIPDIGRCGEGAPVPTPGGSTYPTPDAPPFPFQQNPCTYPDWEASPGTVLEMYEATADMFLNWVYWKNYGPPSYPPIGTPTPSGFGNYTWRSSGCYPDGCLESNPADSGNTRGNWMNGVMTTLFDDFDWS
jgi:hypothetical protein